MSNYKYTPFILWMMLLFFIIVAIKPEIAMTKERLPGQMKLTYDQVKKYVRIFFSFMAAVLGVWLIVFYKWIY